MVDFNPEIRNRIRLSVAAYAYEFEDDPIMSDAEFDELSRQIDTEIETGNREMDHFFWSVFTPDTGLWIHDHPELPGIKRIYRDYFVDRDFEDLI